MDSLSRALSPDALRASPEERMEALLGRTLEGRFEICEILGHGGMGVVYGGMDRVLERPVVIKVLMPRERDPMASARLIREARLACLVEHPAIVTVFHLGILTSGEPYLVMERLVGADLARLLHDCGPFTLTTTLALLEPIADALDALHARGIVHRDIKPHNVFVLGRRLIRPRMKLIDFGLAFLDSETMGRLTQRGIVLGTVEYLAPECARGGAPTPASDVYSFATMAYELLTGHLPFDGAGIDLLVEKTTGAPRSIDAYSDAPEVRAAGRVLERALSKNPALRPTIAQLLGELRAVSFTGAATPTTAQDFIPTVPPPRPLGNTRPTRTVSPAALRPRLVWTGVASVVAFAAGLAAASLT